MTGAVYVALSAVISGASSILAWAHVQRVARAVRADLDSVAASLKRVPPLERSRALLDRSTPGSFEHELASCALAAPNDEARVAAINLSLSEVEHALAERATWPSAGLRIALLGAGLCAFLAYVDEPGQLRSALGALAVGALGALSSAQARRSATQQAEHQRRAIDALVTAAFALPLEPRGAPLPPLSRARRRCGPRAR